MKTMFTLIVTVYINAEHFILILFFMFYFVIFC